MGQVIDFAERKKEMVIREYIHLWTTQGIGEALNYLCEEVDSEEIDAVVDEAKRRVLK